MPVTKVKLTICGANYVVSTTDTEEYVNQLAERLDTDMTEIMAQNPSASVAASAIISALSYLDELSKSSSSTDNMRAQIRDYLEDAAKARLDAENARRQLERLNGELTALKAELARQESREQAALQAAAAPHTEEAQEPVEEPDEPMEESAAPEEEAAEAGEEMAEEAEEMSEEQAEPEKAEQPEGQAPRIEEKE